MMLVRGIIVPLKEYPVIVLVITTKIVLVNKIADAVMPLILGYSIIASANSMLTNIADAALHIDMPNVIKEGLGII